MTDSRSGQVTVEKEGASPTSTFIKSQKVAVCLLATSRASNPHYKTNSRIISRIIRLELVVDYQPDYQLNYQPDYQPGSTEVPVW